MFPFHFGFLPDRVAFQVTTYLAGHRSKRLDRFPRFRGFGTGSRNEFQLNVEVFCRVHKLGFEVVAWNVA